MSGQYGPNGRQDAAPNENPSATLLEVEVVIDADFEKENLHSVAVEIQYDEIDQASGNKRQAVKGLLFTQADNAPKFFRVNMALDAKGQPIDTYSVLAQAHYRNDGEAVTLLNRQRISDRRLVLAPRQLKPRSLVFQAGQIEWAYARRVAIAVELPDGRKANPSEIRLGAQTPRASCTLPDIAGSDLPYRYSMQIVYHNGASAHTDWIESTGEERVIDDPFLKSWSGNFNLTLDPASVSMVQVDVRYQDQEYGTSERITQQFRSSGTWSWSLPVLAPVQYKPAYRYSIEYIDGETRQSDWQEISAGDQTLNLEARRFPFALKIDSRSLDWSRWRKVYLQVHYEDPAHDYEKSALIQLDSNGPEASFSILSFDEQPPRFRYQVRFAPMKGEAVQQAAGTVDKFLLELKNPD